MIFGLEPTGPNEDEKEKGSSEIDCTDEVNEAKSETKKRLQWRWWLITVVVALIGAGFYASQHLTGSYVRRDDYQLAQTTHRESHKEITSKMVDFERTLNEVRIEQAQQTERSKLIDARLELLIERSNRSVPVNWREEADLRETIERQERRLKRLENDPRSKQYPSDDPLSDLSH
jgi:hypothetical protein